MERGKNEIDEEERLKGMRKGIDLEEPVGVRVELLAVVLVLALLLLVLVVEVGLGGVLGIDLAGIGASVHLHQGIGLL